MLMSVYLVPGHRSGEAFDLFLHRVDLALGHLVHLA